MSIDIVNSNRISPGKQKARTILHCFLFTLCLSLVPASSGLAGGKPKKLGGPCQYETYGGRAEIISVHPIESAGDVRAQVRFVFYSDRPVEKAWVQASEKTHSLKMVDGQDPTLDFLKKYGIEAGGTMKCHLKVIVKGTCTPVIFDFPDVDLTDYQP